MSSIFPLVMGQSAQACFFKGLINLDQNSANPNSEASSIEFYVGENILLISFPFLDLIRNYCY